MRLPFFITAVVLPIFVGGESDAHCGKVHHRREILRQAPVVRVAYSQHARSDRGDVSLEELENLALANNPALVEAQARIRAARGNWLQVGLRPNPVIGYMANEIGNEGRGGQQGAFVSQQFITSGKLGLNRRVAQQEVMRTEQEWAARRKRVLSDVRIAFYRTLTAQRRVEVSKSLVETGESGVRAAKARIEAKQGSRIDLLQAETQLETARMLVRNSQNTLDSSWQRLSAVVGDPRLRPTLLAGDLSGGLYEHEFSATLQRLLTESPEMAIAVTNLERARWQLQRELAGRRPNINGQVAIQYDDATDDTVTSVQVGIPLQIHNRNQGNISRAEADVAAARAALQRVEFDLKNRLATAFQRYLNAKQRAERYSSEILPRAQETLDLVQQGYRAGELPFLNVLTAQRTYFQANLAYLDAVVMARENGIAIDGMHLVDSLK